MGLRLARWWHRGSAPAGRHVRVMPAPSVPGAASSLVSSVSLDPAVTGLAPATSAAGGVGLVFADGASVELAADDPRVRTFRAAAAALVQPPAR